MLKLTVSHVAVRMGKFMSVLVGVGTCVRDAVRLLNGGRTIEMDEPNYDVPLFSCAGCGWYFSGRNSEELWGVLTPHLDNDHDGRPNIRQRWLASLEG